MREETPLDDLQHTLTILADLLAHLKRVQRRGGLSPDAMLLLNDPGTYASRVLDLMRHKYPRIPIKSGTYRHCQVCGIILPKPGFYCSACGNIDWWDDLYYRQEIVTKWRTRHMTLKEA